MVRMGTDRAEYVAMRLNDFEQLVEAPDARGDGEHQADACTLRARQHGLALCGKIGEIQVAMAVDEH
jgi:hypothetical protein